MPLTLYYHPLSSYSWKVLIALYESGLDFDGRVVDFSNEASRRALFELWPLGKIPVLRDEPAGRTVAETSIELEYLAQRFDTARWLIPSDPELALLVRFRDRVFDLHVQGPMQKIVADRLRPADARDAHGVAAARRDLQVACALVDGWARQAPWAAGDAFSLADCAAAPALHYADKLSPLRPAFPHLADYLQRLSERGSVARVLQEAEPYAHLFPDAGAPD
jgi:glutathione S-transferase